MYCTDVRELCSAIQNIERGDLIRIVEKVGKKSDNGTKTVYTLPTRNPVHLELYSNGPCSPAVAHVEVRRVYGEKRVYLFCPELDAEIDSAYVYPGHLSVMSNKILELEAVNHENSDS